MNKQLVFLFNTQGKRCYILAVQYIVSRLKRYQFSFDVLFLYPASSTNCSKRRYLSTRRTLAELKPDRWEPPKSARCVGAHDVIC